MTIYTCKAITENLLRKNSLVTLVGFVFLALFSCKNNQDKTKISNNYLSAPEQKNTRNRDTLFFRKKNDSLLEITNKKEAHFFRVIIDSSSIGYSFFDYSTYQFTPKNYEPVETGNIQNIYELNPKKALANGKWIVFENDSHPKYPKFHKIGYYKNGIKDSIWYTNYEDGWNEYFYYKKGNPVDYTGKVKFYDNRDSLVSEGSKFLKTGLPIGKWKYYYINNNVLEHEYIHQKDSILVKYISYNKITKKITGKGAFIAAKYADEFEYKEIEE